MINFLYLFVFILPSYLANSIPVVLGGGTPIDLNARFSDGKRILGPKKTIRGFIAGVVAGTAIGGLLALYYPLPYFSSPSEQFIASFLLAFGTMFGDALGSFIKRRMNVAPGKPFLLDSILFLVVALLLAFPFTSSEIYTLIPLLFLFALTLVLHPLTNMLANRLGMKSVPW